MTTPRKENPGERGWGEFQQKQARPVLIHWVRYRSIRNAAVQLGHSEHTIKRYLDKGLDGCFPLYGCACTVEGLKARGCTCNDD